MIQKFENIYEKLNQNPNTDVKVLLQSKKRLGTLYWINGGHDGNKNKIDIGKIWTEGYNLIPQDYQINICLGVYNWMVIFYYFYIKFLKLIRMVTMLKL